MMWTQGILTYQKFNTHDDKFHAEFTINTNVTESSVLYLNKEYHYPGGYHITLTVDGLKLHEGAQYTVDTSDV
jgi:hypothetical protein